jgi:hypothetical protein
MTRQGESEVAVFEGDARRLREQRARTDHAREVRRRNAELPVAPGIIGHETGRVVQQIAQRDRAAVGGGQRRRGELRHVGGDRRVERDLAFIAQHQDRERGHGLGHRGDAEAGTGGHRPPGLAIGSADGLGPAQRAIGDQPEHEAWNVVLLGEVLQRRAQRLRCLSGEGRHRIHECPE